MINTHVNIGNAAAAAKLRQLALNPYDLRGENALLKDDRIERYICRTGPFRLHFATERVDDQVLDALQQLADECGVVEQFGRMKNGEVLNRIEGYPSEERQVLHTACRDIFSKKPREPVATAQAKKELTRLRRFLEELNSGEVLNQQGERFTTMVNVGIGGSDLGPRSLYEALKPYRIPGRRVEFIANVDPDDAAQVLENVDLEKTLVNVVSKSGTTIETLTNERLVVDRLQRQGLDPAKHCIAVTGQGSPMDNPGKYLRSFSMFDSIGGRYSSTSMVGCVMLGFCLGYEQLEALLHGAAAMDERAESPSIRDNIPLLMALLGVWNHNFLGANTVAILPYCQALHRFPAHLQQCDMESNGKSIDRRGRKVKYKTGPIVWGEPGTNGQHAFYQLLHQGTEIVPVEFIGFLESQYGVDMQIEGSSSQEKLLANLLAQAIAFATGKDDANPNRVFAGNRPSSILFADRLTPETMGGLLALYEAKITFQGFLWDINSFDQEGVQLGKVLATRILDRIQAIKQGTALGDKSVETRFLKASFQSTRSTDKC